MRSTPTRIPASAPPATSASSAYAFLLPALALRGVQVEVAAGLPSAGAIRPRGLLQGALAARGKPPAYLGPIYDEPRQVEMPVQHRRTLQGPDELLAHDRRTHKLNHEEVPQVPQRDPAARAQKWPLHLPSL